MTHLLVAEFETAEAMNRAAASAAKEGHAAQDALTPFPVPEVLEHLTHRRKRPVGWVMVIAGTTAAAVGWFMQWYSATIDYPVLSGGRPFNSWPIFLLVMYEACILFATIAGFVALARDCRLPSLNHPLFEIAALERATQDRFFLLFEAPEHAREEMSHLVAQLKPISTNELAL